MPNDPRFDALRTSYEEVCRAHDGIHDFRSKLLALLPLASGGGILLLLKPAAYSGNDHLLAIGSFGVLMTIALFIYELRGIQKCIVLAECGKNLERELLGKAESLGAFTDDPKAAFKVISHTWASLIIYSTVIAAWTYVACMEFFPSGAIGISAVSLIVSSAAGWLGTWQQQRMLERQRKAYQQEEVTNELEAAEPSNSGDANAV